MSQLTNLPQTSTPVTEVMTNANVSTNTYTTTTDGPDQDPCDYVEYIDAAIIMYMIFPAIAVVLILSFFKRRKKLCVDKCWGRPHLVYPINLVDDYGHRWVYACVFVLITYKVLLLFEGYFFWKPSQFDDAEWMETYGWCRVFVVILNTAMMVVVYYPFFVCISMRRMISANLMGLIYLCPWLWYFIEIWKFCPTWTTSETGKTEISYRMISQLIPDIPVVIAFLTLIVAYIVDLVKNIYALYLKKRQNLKYKEKQFSKYSQDPRAVIYTKELMRKVPKNIPASLKEKIKFHASYSRLKGFKYSPRVLCTMAVAVIGLLKIALQAVIFVEWIYGFVIELYNSLEPGVEVVAANYTGSYAFYREWIYVGRWSCYVGIWLSFILHILFMIHMVIMYRKHLLRYLEGDRTWHFKNVQSPVDTMVVSLRYSGYQVAYIIYGFIILLVLLSLLSFAFGVLICLPIKYRYINFLIRFLINYWPTLLVTILVLVSQKILAKFFLLQGFGKYLALDNRRFYHILSLFVFFYNFLLGIFSCLKRILLSAAFGTLLISRLDCCLMMRGFERFDAGFRAYLGMLQIDACHNNPVAKTFIHILSEAVEERKDKQQQQRPQQRPQSVYRESYTSKSDLEIGIQHNVDEIPMTSEDKKSKRWRNKWWKAITLINNPCLHLDLLKQEVIEMAKDKQKFKDSIINTAATVVSGLVVGTAVGETMQ